jgi:hypothetical protein
VIATATSRDIDQALAELFVSAAAAVARRLELLGLQPTVEEMRPEITRMTTENSSSVGMERVPTTKNTLADFHVIQEGAPWLTDVEIDQLNTCAALVSTKYAATLPFGAPSGGRTWPLIEPSYQDYAPDYTTDPHDWTSRMLIQPALLYHLQRVDNVSSLREDAQSVFAADVIDVAKAESIDFLSVVPISGITLDQNEGQSYTHGSVRVRELSDHEQAQWWIDQQERRVWSVGMMIQPPETLLEIKISSPRDSLMFPSRDYAGSLVAAFYIHGHQITGTVVAESADPPWVMNGGRHSGPLPIPRRSTNTTTTLTPDDFRGVVDTAELLGKYNIREPGSAKDLTVHRFITGITRETEVDAIIDFTIALESLLLPLDPSARHGDLSYRFRMHGAHYIARNSNERSILFDQLKQIYDTRSRLVHGGKYPKSDKIKEVRRSAYELVRRGLYRALHEGFPTADTFTQALLEPVGKGCGRLVTGPAGVRG